MKTTIIIVISLCCFIQVAQAQKVSFEGEVRDSLNNRIEYANIMAVDTVKNTIAAFAVSNREGLFKLTLEKDKPYFLKISFVGFKPFQALILGQDTREAPILVKLNPDLKMVQGVEVVSEMPVLISGDTITYKTDVFTDGSERKLEDVLEKLPGFEVDENGEVKVQGKRVDKLLVDGKEFFDGDTKMAIKNLPANAVDRVQVLQNFNDVSPMKGLGNNETLALNITLKEDKKNMVFGDLTAGAGPEERYLGKANLFFYSPKTNVNVIAGANNIGDQTFSLYDYFRFSGGLANLGRRSGSSFQISQDNLGIPMANRNSARSLDTKLGAINFTVNPSEKWRHSGFIIGSTSDNNMGSVSQRTYIGLPGNDQENLTTISNVQNTSGLLKYSARFTPNASLHMDYSVFTKLSDINNNKAQLSEFANASNNIVSADAQQPFSLEQQFQAFYAPDAKNVFSLQITYQYKDQNAVYDLLTDQKPFVPIIPLVDAMAYNLLQTKNIISRKQEAAFNYYRILNKTNHINFKIGNSYARQELTSNIQQKQSDQPFTDPNLNNDVDYTFSDIFFGMMYKTKIGKLTLSPGFNIHNYNFTNRQLGSEEQIKKTLLLPELYAKYNIRGSHSLTMNYSVNTAFTDIQNLASGLIIKNYNTLFAGNRELENSWYHQLNLNYFNFNMFDFVNIYGGLTYQKRFDGITNTIQFGGLGRILSPVNIGVANEIMSGNINFSKTYDLFKINLSANLSESKSNNVVSDVATENKSFTQNYNASVETSFFKKLNLEVGYTKIFNEYNGNSTINTYETDRPFAKLNARFLKGFRVDIDYEYNNYKSNTTNVSQSYDLMNAELSYQKSKSKWEFRASALNLLNTTSIRRDSFSESLISTFEYFIQKRYYMFSIKYDL